MKIASACITVDWVFTLNIGDLNVDTNSLEELSTHETCTISEDFLTIKSHYDERVAVIIGKTASILGFKGITIRLPYDLDEDGGPIVSSINPEAYNWEESVKTDLTFLKEAGVLEIGSVDIEQISTLATNGKNILYCENEWTLVAANCQCGGLCVACTGAPPLATSLPQKLLTLEPLANPPHLYFLVLPIALVLPLVVFYGRKKRARAT